MSETLTHPWQDVPVWTLFRSVARESDGSSDVLSLHRGLGVLKKGSVEGNHNRTPEDLTRYQAVQLDDVVVNRMKAWQGSAGVAPQSGIISAHYLVFEPLQDAYDARFLNWLLASPLMTERYQRASVGIRTSQWELSRGAFAELRIPLPPLEVQRRVAVMLDVETARIDTLIAKNNQVLDLLQVRWQSLLEAAIFGDASTNRVPLWLTCDVTPGYAFPSAEFQPNGPVRLLRGINVGVGSINWDETVYGEWSTVEPAEEYRLVAGDLVLGMDRPWISSGLRVAKVEASDEPAFLVQRVARLRPHAGLDRDYLYQVLQSRRFFAAFEPSMTGVSVPHVSGGQIGNFRIPLPSLSGQERLVGELDRADRRARQLRAQVEHQQELLRLRRRALISAAVTGQIDV